MLVKGAGRSLNQVKAMNLLKGPALFSEDPNDPMQMPPMSLMPQPVVAATYYFSSYRRPLTGGGPSTEPADRCEAADARQGTCYDTADCIELGGTPMGRCPSEGVCCIFDVQCGGATSEVVSYFRNPRYPSAYEQEGTCKIRVAKHSDSICQIKLEFLVFDLARPIDGNCSQDMLVITGQNENNLIPKICGLNSGQHYYVDVEDSGAISLHVTMVGIYGRRFNIKINQVRCIGRDAAPPHCLQYHRGTRGAIKSFNYDEPGLLGLGYPNNMDYVICIRKEPGFCSITYQLFSEGRNVAPFAVGALPGAANAALGLTGPVAAECHDDYVLFTGIRVCSGRVSPTGAPNRPAREPNTTTTYILTDATPGPFLVRFVSNGVRNARGFHFTYRQNPCK
ncbi:CUB domain-containing protein [Caerostris darwini]|uniref:CUB domain-containing protein n=1 Tax=Caerostris darwini TaxID=1538125 RepID=A0AAV4TFI7_9ARAC|nr:CUB domain-containing protein [Caerostris darwini]